MKKAFVIAVLGGLTIGLEIQFIRKMIYFPEPLIPIILEMLGIIILAGVAARFVWRL